MGAPEPVRAGGVAGLADLGGEGEVGVVFQQLHHRPVEGGEPFGRGGARSQRRGAVEELLLDVLGGRIEPGRVFDRAVPLERGA